jgi:hypothetical protein
VFLLWRWPRPLRVRKTSRKRTLKLKRFAPKDFTPEMLRPLAKNDYDWHPERSAIGPITMVVSAADKAIYVYRNGNPIGRARWRSDAERSAVMCSRCSKVRPAARAFWSWPPGAPLDVCH